MSFHHANPQNIVWYEAYVDRVGGNKCTGAAHARTPKCTLRGIREAVNFRIMARACFASMNKCEPTISVLSQTKLRGNSAWYF